MNKGMKHNFNNLRRKVLYDLFVTTENIIKGFSSITINPIANGFLECKIGPPGNHPTVVLTYDFSERQSSNEEAIGNKDLNRLRKNKNWMPLFSQLSLSAPTVLCDVRKPIKEVTTENSSGSNLEVLTTPVRRKSSYKRANKTNCVVRKLPDRLVSRKNREFKQATDEHSGSATSTEGLRQQTSKGNLAEVVDSKRPNLYSPTGRKKRVNNTPLKITYKRIWTRNSIHNSRNETTPARKKYNCRFCYRYFYEKRLKMQHEKLHKLATSFKCAYCSMPFTNLSNRLKHERIHTGEKPYKCKYCEKRFIQTSNRNTHERTHTKKKLFSCGSCGKRFRKLSIKNNHEKTHEKD